MNYIILSEGAYSDYSPTYYVGERLITQEEMDKKSIEIGDKLYAEFDALPTRKHEPCFNGEHFSYCKPMEKYYPDTGERAYSGDLAPKFFKQMAEWLKEQGYLEISEPTAEINISYSEIPTSKDK